MAVVNIVKNTGPQVYVDTHLDYAYIILRENQVKIRTDGSIANNPYDAFEITVEEFAVNDRGIADKTTSLSINKYVVPKAEILPRKEEGTPEYSVKIPINNSYYELYFRTVEYMKDAPEESTASAIYSDDTILTINNFLTWIYPELLLPTLNQDVRDHFDSRNDLVIYGNLLPIGSKTGDILILNPSTAYVQQFKFSDFYDKTFYSPSWASIANSWWSLEINSNTFKKNPISQKVKDFLIALVSIPGLKEIIETKEQALTGTQLQIIYGTTVGDASNLYLPVCFKIDSKIYTVFFIGDFKFTEEMFIQELPQI